MISKINQNFVFDFRIDDIGASSKLYEQYSKIPIIGNIGFLKNRLFFGNWGPYQELTPEELEKLILIFNENDKNLAIAITAAWVGKDNKIIPFDRKFPDQARIIKEAYKEGLLKVLNHGLSHCVIGMHMPNLISSNRRYHREFVDWLPEFIHKKHIQISQEILENWIQDSIIILAPPGNNYSLKTIKACENTNIKFIHSSRDFFPNQSSISHLSLGKCVCFHDREIKLYGESFINNLLKK